MGSRKTWNIRALRQEWLWWCNVLSLPTPTPQIYPAEPTKRRERFCVGVFSRCEANHILPEHGAGSNCNLKTYQDLWASLQLHHDVYSPTTPPHNCSECWILLLLVVVGTFSQCAFLASHYTLKFKYSLCTHINGNTIYNTVHETIKTLHPECKLSLAKLTEKVL